MHSDILSEDKSAIADADTAGIGLKKVLGNRFDVSEIMKSYGTFVKAAKTLVKDKVQELPIKIRMNRANSGNSKNDVFHKRLKSYLKKEIHIKLEDDESPVLYTLKEIEKDFLVVNYGESLRFIPINKIIFLQIGEYPKD